MAAIVAVASTVLASIEADNLHTDVMCETMPDINCNSVRMSEFPRLNDDDLFFI